MQTTIRPGAVKARDYEGHFRAVANVTIGYATRRIQVHPRAWPTRSDALSAAKTAIADREQDIIEAALARIE